MTGKGSKRRALCSKSEHKGSSGLIMKGRTLGFTPRNEQVTCAKNSATW